MKYKNKIKNKRSSSGITLIESVVYVSILAIILVVVVNTVILSASAFGKSRVKKNVFTQGSAALGRILHEVRLADDVIVIDSVFGVSPGTLKLNTILSSSDETPTTRKFSLPSQSIILKEGASATSTLTTGVTVTNLTFYYLNDGAKAKAIRIMITIKDTLGRFEAEETFYGTAVLRRNY